MAGRTALITGASSGIGAELARVCAADAWNLVLVARRTDRLEALAAELSRAHNCNVRVLPADLAHPAAPQDLFDRLRGTPIDLLVNNAGFGTRGAYAETDWDTEARMIQVNVTALAHLTKLFVRDMLARRSGRILNVASTAGFVPGPFMAVYYATKAFVVSLSEAVASEVEGSGVTVTVLCPGPTTTEFSDVAGTAQTRLFRSKAMTAMEVAREGYQAAMQGKPTAIAGARNRWMIWGTRFAPRILLARVTRRMNT